MITVLAHDTSLRPRALAHAPSRIVSPIADDAHAASAESEPSGSADAADATADAAADAAADDDVYRGADLASSRMTRAYARPPTLSIRLAHHRGCPCCCFRGVRTVRLYRCR